MANNYEGEHPLRPICAGWLGKVDRARKAKKKFQDVADECMRFFDGPAGFMWDADYKGKVWSKDLDNMAPSFRMTVNKVFELVSLFGPVLYHRNPVRRVTPRQYIQAPPQFLGINLDPMSGMPLDQMAAMQMQMIQQQSQMEQMTTNLRAQLLETYLNYTPNELNLASHFQRAITEALIKGRGVVWVEPHFPPESDRMMVGSFYDTVDNLLIDPDAEELEDARYVIKECCHQVWEVEKEYNLPPGLIKGNMESGTSQGESVGDRTAKSKRSGGLKNDMLRYYKVWSKMGIGARSTDLSDEKRAQLDIFGDYCYLVVAKDIPFPLNMPPEFLETAQDEELLSACAWPVPFWRDGGWPFSEVDFYQKPRSVWPISPVSPGLGELKFINWCMSFLANRIRTSCRDFIGVAKGAAEEIKKTIQHGGDFTMLEVEAVHGSINNVVSFLQHPQVNHDIWDILTAVMQMFDKRVGLSELLYGMQNTQARSATEMRVKQEQISVRPDYMASCVENAATKSARLEALAARWYVEPQDTVHILGQQGAMLWQQLVMSSDVEATSREMDYRVEASSARKPNLDRFTANMQDAMPMLAPILDQYATMTGDTGPINNLIQKWGESIQQDLAGMMMSPRVPAMPSPVAPQEEDEGSDDEGGNKNQ